MRTTLDIDDDLLRMVRALARERRLSVDDTVSDLLRRALPPRWVVYPSGFPVFCVPEDAQPITSEMVREAL